MLPLQMLCSVEVSHDKPSRASFGGTVPKSFHR
jgi:hypothetical protein